MSQYLLSTYVTAGEEPKTMTHDELQVTMESVAELEHEMESSGALAYSARLHSPHKSSVVRPGDGEPAVTEGPLPEAKEHMAGFYIIHAENMEEALEWAKRVAHSIKRPIEVRQFFDFHRK